MASLTSMISFRFARSGAVSFRHDYNRGSATATVLKGQCHACKYM